MYYVCIYKCFSSNDFSYICTCIQRMIAVCVRDCTSVILPSIPGLSNDFVSLSCAHRNPVCVYCRFHACYMFHPTYRPWFVLQKKHFIGVTSCEACHSVIFSIPLPLRPQYLSQHSILEHPQPVIYLMLCSLATCIRVCGCLVRCITRASVMC